MVYSLLAVAFSIFCEKNSTIFRNAHYLSMGDQLGHSSHNNLPHSQRVHIRENNESHFFSEECNDSSNSLHGISKSNVAWIVQSKVYKLKLCLVPEFCKTNTTKHIYIILQTIIINFLHCV